MEDRVWVVMRLPHFASLASACHHNIFFRTIGMVTHSPHHGVCLCRVRSFAYECNNFAGTMAAIEMLLTPPANASAAAAAAVQPVNCSDRAAVAAAHADAATHVVGGPELFARQTLNALLWPLAFAIYLSGTRRVSLLCSGVVGFMLLCFAVTLAGAGLPPPMQTLRGLVPSIPPGASELVLGVMGTTSIPVNILMGSSLARDAPSLGAMRRGVGLASMLSGVLSLLVQLVGTHVRAPTTRLPRPP